MGRIFEKIKVLDFTNNAAGPTASSLLADFGAEVIKIERPVIGDDSRGFAPRIEGQALNSMWLNRGKKSVAIALDDPEGIEIVKKLIPQVDVVIESFRPGIMKKFGLDYDSISKIKEDIIYCSVSAFGQYGPYAMKPGYDLIAQGLSGIMDLTGDLDGDPQKSGTILGDYVGGLNAYGSIVSAIYHHSQTGEGQYIDVALYESLTSFNQLFESAGIGNKVKRTGNHHSTLCPYGLYGGKDGQSMIICAINNKLWTILCNVMGKPEAIIDDTFSTGFARSSNVDRVIELIETYLKTFDDIQDAVDIMDKAGIPCCKVKTTQEVLEDEHLIARGGVFDLPTTTSLQSKGIKTIKVRGVWNKFSKTPGEMKQAPDVGEHTEEILTKYGVDKLTIKRLSDRWLEKVVSK